MRDKIRHRHNDWLISRVFDWVISCDNVHFIEVVFDLWEWRLFNTDFETAAKETFHPSFKYEYLKYIVHYRKSQHEHERQPHLRIHPLIEYFVVILIELFPCRAFFFLAHVWKDVASICPDRDTEMKDDGEGDQMHHSLVHIGVISRWASVDSAHEVFVCPELEEEIDAQDRKEERKASGVDKAHEDNAEGEAISRRNVKLCWCVEFVEVFL